jgi:hypothetical protein
MEDALVFLVVTKASKNAKKIAVTIPCQRRLQKALEPGLHLLRITIKIVYMFRSLQN